VRTVLLEDRHVKVEPGQRVVTDWVDIDLCVLGCRERMDFVAVERAGRRLLRLGGSMTWPPPVGQWRDDGRFVVLDGRHELLAALALGREKVFVCWVEAVVGSA
jgi:hypothetical protein